VGEKELDALADVKVALDKQRKANENLRVTLAKNNLKYEDGLTLLDDLVYEYTIRKTSILDLAKTL